jgi:colanic acid/amylovoran biosynthesis glycosyltransferase
MTRDKAHDGIGYVLRKFPVLSETFILNEILALEAREAAINIFSLARPNDPRYHEDLPRVKALISYVPEISELGTLLRHARKAARRFGRTYWQALGYCLRQGRPGLLLQFLQACYVANEARRLKLTHLHAHFATEPSVVAFLASRITGISYSFTAHAMDIYKEEINKKDLVKRINYARFMVTVSEYNKEYLTSLANGASARIHRIYNGINLDRFTKNGMTQSTPFTILCVARLVEKKGLPILLEACRILRDRNAEFQCLVIGKGRLRPNLQEQIKKSDLEEHVHLLGPQTQMEVLKHYHSAHVFVLPCIVGSDGNRDGLPVVITEALACGLPVISTPVTGIPEVVRHLHNGTIVPSGDAVALADAIKSLLDDPDLYHRLCENARPSIAAEFDMHRTAEILHGLFSGAQT